MISVQEARTKALKLYPKVDAMIDEPKAFIFVNSKAKTKAEKTDNEVVVLKDTGEIVSYFKYLMEIK